jgi:hypothetical protein
MGFPPSKVEAAIKEELCTTLRRAVEWLCLQEAGNVQAPVVQASEEPTPQASSIHPVKNDDGEGRTTEDAEAKAPSRLASDEIATPQRMRSNVDVMPLEASSSGMATRGTSPQSKEMHLNPSEKAQSDTLQQDVFGKRRLSIIRSPGAWAGRSPGSASRRTSLGSLLSVPAEAWSADQLQAALKQLHSFGAQRQTPPVRTFTRKRLRSKQSVPYDFSLQKNSPQRNKRIRLYFKQPSSAYPIIASNPSSSAILAATASGNAGPSGGGKVPKAIAKWKSLLLDMGFSENHVDSNLRKYKSLDRAIDVLCS